MRESSKSLNGHGEACGKNLVTYYVKEGKPDVGET